MIVIRAEGGPSIGSGHIMRCMTIAEELRKAGEILFVTGDKESVHFIEDRGFPAMTFEKTREGGLCEEEIPELLQILREKEAECILVDSYQVTDVYLEKLNSNVPTAYMDDEGKKTYPVSCVINYNVYADENDYALKYDQKQTRLLIGPSYIPIRHEFSNTKYEVKKEIKDILITTGGGDMYDIAGKLLGKMMQSQSSMTFNLHIVSGVYNKNHENLKKAAYSYSNVIIHENVKDIWNLMAKCDMAITAGGSTTYELCAIGVPMIGYIFADNQKMLMGYLDNRGIVSYCGDFRKEPEIVLAKIMDESEKYADHEIRKNHSKEARKLVDCEGAARIASKLLTLY